MCCLRELSALHDTGVEAEVVMGDPGTAQTSRVTVTRLIGLGIFALAAPKKSGGAQPKAILFIANQAGKSITVTLDAAKPRSIRRRRGRRKALVGFRAPIRMTARRWGA